MLKNRLQTLPKSLDAMGTRLPLNIGQGHVAGSEDPYSTIESQVGLIYPTPAASDDSNNSSNSSSKGRRSVYNMQNYIEESPYMPKICDKSPNMENIKLHFYGGTICISEKCQPSKPVADNKKKPLQEKQLNGIATCSYDFDKRIGDLLPSNQIIAENFNANSNDSGLSSASSISPPQQTNDTLGKQLTPRKAHL
ncbi:hypothetical protein EVAR_70107_1, partial [Eumeta japonica]